MIDVEKSEMIKMELNQKKTEKHKEEDKLTNAIGELGKWQIMMLLVVLWPTKLSAAWQQLGIIFIAPNTTFICTATNLTKNIVTSKCYNDCIKYEYQTDFGNTIISQWDLVCDRAWMTNFTQTVAMFGVLLGSILFGFLADRYGRRPAFLAATMLQLCTSVAEAFSPSYWMFTSIRFFLGLSTAGIMLCAFTFIIEITGPRKRELIACLSGLPIGVGEMIMPIFAYFLRTYDMFCLGIAIPNFIYLLYFFIMPESPKWLISMGKLEDASKVMKQAAEWNNLPSEHMIDIAQSIVVDEANFNINKQEKATYLALLKTRTLRLYTFCSCTIWFMIGVTFYGSNQYIGQSSSDVFISISTAGALQIPGMLIAALLCKYIGRRLTLIGFFSVCALCNALVAIPNDWFYFKLVMGTIAVSCAAGAFSAIYLYTSELFPTVTRNMAMGASSTGSRMGSMLAPFVAGLSVTATWLPSIVFALAPLIAAMACYCLPETRGKKLADYVA